MVLSAELKLVNKTQGLQDTVKAQWNIILYYPLSSIRSMG